MQDEPEKASITYKLSEDGSIIVDVLIDDFDTESIEALAQICAKVSSEQLSYETVRHIRDLLYANDQIALLVPFVAKLNDESAIIKKLFHTKEHNESDKSQPCIRPSDMI